MAVRARGLTGTSRLLPVGFGAALAVASVGAAFAVTRAASDERASRLVAASDAAADRIAATIERDLAEIAGLAAAADDTADFRRAAQPKIDQTEEILAVALTEREGDRLIVRTAVPSDLGVVATGNDIGDEEPELEIVVSTILGEADPFIGAPFDLDGRQVLTIAAPVFDADARTEDARRASTTGAVVAVVSVADVLAGGWPGGVQLTSPRGRVAGGVDDVAVERSVDIAGRTWRLALGAHEAGPPRSTWLVLGGGLVLAAAVSLALRNELRRRREAEVQAAHRSRQLERIAESGARLQQSLDLSELLPTFAVSLAADFDLAAVSISLLDGDGGLVEAFATGERDDAATNISIPLRRGWRAVGVLTVRPRLPLDDAARTSLQALADLLAVAMSNAQLYEREQLSAARLRDLDALKNAFLGTVSHELRTSMTAIMGFGELLSDSWDMLDEERRREMAGRIRRSAGSLRHLVDDLLDFARLEQERLRVQPRDIDLASIVRQTVEGLSPLLGNHELDLQVSDSVPAWADPIAVERILANLVSNAAKYSPAGTKVTVSVRSTPGAARLVVSDEGPGIPPDERRRIFARFYRLSTPESVRSRGAGIGLAILRDFADRSSAHVEVDDAPGGGARFTIDFPTEPVAAPLQDTLIAG